MSAKLQATLRHQVRRAAGGALPAGGGGCQASWHAAGPACDPSGPDPAIPSPPCSCHATTPAHPPTAPTPFLHAGQLPCHQLHCRGAAYRGGPPAARLAAGGVHGGQHLRAQGPAPGVSRAPQGTTMQPPRRACCLYRQRLGRLLVPALAKLLVPGNNVLLAACDALRCRLPPRRAQPDGQAKRASTSAASGDSGPTNGGEEGAEQQATSALKPPAHLARMGSLEGHAAGPAQDEEDEEQADAATDRRGGWDCSRWWRGGTEAWAQPASCLACLIGSVGASTPGRQQQAAGACIAPKCLAGCSPAAPPHHAPPLCRPCKRVCYTLEIPEAPAEEPHLPASRPVPAAGAGTAARKRRTACDKMRELESSIQEATFVGQHLQQAVARAEAQVHGQGGWAGAWSCCFCCCLHVAQQH